jgi:hypothetical protein
MGDLFRKRFKAGVARRLNAGFVAATSLFGRWHDCSMRGGLGPEKRVRANPAFAHAHDTIGLLQPWSGADDHSHGGGFDVDLRRRPPAAWTDIGSLIPGTTPLSLSSIVTCSPVRLMNLARPVCFGLCLPVTPFTTLEHFSC